MYRLSRESKALCDLYYGSMVHEMGRRSDTRIHFDRSGRTWSEARLWNNVEKGGETKYIFFNV